MNSTTEILKIKKGEAQKRDVGAVQTGILFGIWVISRVLDVQMISNFYTNLVRHRPITFMWTSRSKKAVFKSKLQQQRRSPNLSSSPDTVQCSAHILSSRSTNDLIFFVLGKLREFPRTFMISYGSSSDISNVVLFRQEDKDFHQVKMWPPPQQLFIKSIVSNFGL